jgi:3-hydroxy-9,10-secoandrosta-1,3,5(10)-triene-9,17-dione monooxygenase
VTVLASGRSSDVRPEAILQAARQLAPRLRANAGEAEALRQLPDTTIEEAERGGIFRLLVPHALGGADGSARDFVDLIRILAAGDLASAWTLSFLTCHAWLMARFPAEARAELFADGRAPLVTMSARPPGRAVPVDGGYELTGRWGYCSAVMHADWVAVVGLVDGLEEEAVDAVQGLADQASMFVLPRSDVEVLDTWHMAGMQSTGSHDVTTTGAFVPAHRCISIDAWHVRDNLAAASYPGATSTYDTRDLLSFLKPSMAVGAAQGLLDDFRQRIERRNLAFTKTAVADTVPGQMRYARALAALRLAESSLERALSLIEEANAATTDELSHEQRALLKLDQLNTFRMVRECAELVMAGSGSSVFKTDDPMQRTVRDLQMLLSHLTIDEDRFVSKAGEILLGRATDADPTQNFT